MNLVAGETSSALLMMRSQNVN